MNEAGQLVIFEAENGPVQVRLEGETVWLTQAQMAELFGTSSDNISLHLKNIYKERELQEAATTEDFSVVRQEGARQVRRRLKHYNLDAIISVGYRVSSAKATRFRQWATAVLREHLTRGFTLDHQRFERNAAELEAALQLVRRAAAGAALTADQGRGLVGEWVEAELVPAIRATLAAEKDGLIAIAPEIAAGITAELNKALLATIKEKLEKSWERKKIFEALLA